MENSEVVMTDEDLEKILGLPSGYVSMAPADDRAQLEKFRAAACKMAKAMDSEFLFGGPDLEEWKWTR